MEFELKLSASSDESRLILSGNGPHKPSDTSERTFKFESFVRMVNNESMENFAERVLGETVKFPEGEDLFPTTVNLVM